MIEFVKGGLDSSNPNRYKYITGRILNTRLMGVVCLHLEYEDLLTDKGNFHQFYYYDYEETGLEEPHFLRTKKKEEAEKKERSSFAGLGGEILTISEREAQYYLRWMVAKNRERGIALPRELSEVKWILEGEETLDELEIASFEKKICVPVRTDFGVVNYYLMRCIGRDLSDGAKRILAPNLEEHPMIPAVHSTFLKNKITDVTLERKVGEGIKVYRCEAITLEDGADHNDLVLSEVWVKDREVIFCERLSCIHMSDYESACYLNREEFVTVCSPKAGLETLLPLIEEHMLDMTRNSYPAGELFILYNSDNRHVEKRNYSLNDDVNTLFFFTETGQLILCSYGLLTIYNSEAKIFSSALMPCYEITGRYQFASSMFYDFLESGVSNFQDYMAMLDFE